MTFYCVDIRLFEVLNRHGEIQATKPLKIFCDYFLDRIEEFEEPSLIENTAILSELGVDPHSGRVPSARCVPLKEPLIGTKRSRARAERRAGRDKAKRATIRAHEQDCVSFPDPTAVSDHDSVNSIATELHAVVTSQTVEYELNPSTPEDLHNSFAELDPAVLAEDIWIGTRGLPSLDEELDLVHAQYVNHLDAVLDSAFAGNNYMFEEIFTCAQAGDTDVTLHATISHDTEHS